MKVLLLEDVYKKGVAGEVVDVAPGYARNYLIPRGMAVKATPGALRQLENLRSRAEARREERSREFSDLAERIEKLTLYFGVKAGETGKLYGSVTSAEIAEQLHEQLGLEIDRRRVGDRPLRELGVFHVPVRLETGLVPNVKVVIHREGEGPRQMEAVLVEAVEGEAEFAPSEAEAAWAEEETDEEALGNES